MNLKEKLLILFKENNIKVKKLKGRQRTLYKINGNLLYITFKERVQGDKNIENYYLQVNEKLVKDVLSDKQNITIFIICGSLRQILVIDGKEFLELTKNTKIYTDGNIKFNVLVTKRKTDFNIRFTEIGVFDVNKYVNAFNDCSLTEKVLKVVNTIQERNEYEIRPEKKIEIPQIQIIRKEKIIFNEFRLKEYFISGEGDKLEKFLLHLFGFWGFKIDEETSGQNGELDVICISPIRIGIECRSTKGTVGVNIIDELNRHIRRYENRSRLPDFIGLVICDNPTKQLIEDVKTEQRYLMDSESIIQLIRFSIIYPLSPLEFEYFFKDFGDIRDNLIEYLNKKLEKIKIKESIVSIFTNVGEVLDYADIKANLKVIGFGINNEFENDLKESLLELSSPLINWLERSNNQYKLIFSEKFLENQQKKSEEILKWIQ